LRTKIKKKTPLKYFHLESPLRKAKHFQHIKSLTTTTSIFNIRYENTHQSPIFIHFHIEYESSYFIIYFPIHIKNNIYYKVDDKNERHEEEERKVGE